MKEHDGVMAKWWERMWWMRGVVGALTVTSLVPEFIDLSRLQFLRAIHLVTLEWDKVATFLGSVFGLIPFIPDLSAELVNLILFLASVGLPAIFGLSKAAYVTLTDEFRYGPTYNVEGSFVRKLKRAGRFSLILTAFLGVGMTVVAAPTYLFIWFPTVLEATERTDQALDLGEPAPFVVLGLMGLLYGIINVPAFGRALLLTVSCLCTFEVLYHLNALVLSEFVDRYYCGNINPNSPDCTQRQ